MESTCGERPLRESACSIQPSGEESACSIQPSVRELTVKPFLLDPLESVRPGWLMRSPTDIVNTNGKRYLFVTKS